MNRNQKKSLAAVFLAVISTVFLTACSGSETAASPEAASSAALATASGAASAAQSQSAQSETAADENTVYGSVTAIDGASITLALGTVNADAQGQGGGTPPSGDAGAMPSGQPSGDAGAMPSGQPSGDPGAMPSGQPSGDAPAMPSGEAGEMPSMLTLTGEETTITVTDESLITAENGGSETTGLAAIEVGSTLKIIYADDAATIQSIVVLNGMGGGAPGGQAKNANTADASASPSA